MCLCVRAGGCPRVGVQRRVAWWAEGRGMAAGEGEGSPQGIPGESRSSSLSIQDFRSSFPSET